MKTWGEILTLSGEYLASKGVPDASVAVELLMARLLKCGRGFLAPHLMQTPDERYLEAMRRGMARLVKGEPIQYVLGEWDFRTLEFRYECYREENRNAQSTTIDHRSFILARSYEKLGLDANASESDVKRAFRERVKNCHPDRIPENASQKEREEAVQLFRQTKEAYEEICKASGYR